MANIKDVAKKANVSVATVSRVINNKGYVNEETRQLVEAAIKELNYIPNEFARSLFKKVSKTIGVIFPHLSNPFYHNVLEGIEEVCFENGYKVMICNSLEDATREEEYLKQFVKYKIDGIITGSDSNMLEKYLDLKIPIVSIDRFIADNIPLITSDNIKGGYLAGQKLIRTGSKKIIHFRGPSILLTVQERSKGFQQALKESNLSCDQVDLAFVNPEVELIRNYLENNLDVDGIFCDSDTIAAIVMKELFRLNRKVPKDVQVIGYDNTNLSTLVYPALSTISQNMLEIGREAMNALQTLIDKEEIEQYHKVIPVTFIERESTRKG